MVESSTTVRRRNGLGAEKAKQLLLGRQADDALARSVRLAAVALRAPVVTLGVPVGDRLMLAAQVGVPEPWHTVRSLPLKALACRYALDLLEPLVIECLGDDPRTTKDVPVDDLPRGGYCGIALWFDDEPVAVLGVTDAVPRRWTAEEVSLLRDVSASVVRDLELLAQGDVGGPVLPGLDTRSGFCTLDNSWRFTSVNARAELLLQRSRVDLVGRSLWQQFPQLVGGVLHHEWLKAQVDGVASEQEEYWPMLDAWLETRVHPVPGGMAVQLRDMTGRRRFEDELRAKEARWRTLLEDTGSAIFVSTPDGRLTDYNRATLQLLGVTAEDVGQLNVESLYVERADRAAFRRAVEGRGSVVNQEVRLRRPADGSVRICVITANAQRSPDGTVVAYEGVLRDVTEQKAAEEKLAQSAFHDPLTALPNRALLLDRLGRLLKHSKRRKGYRFAVLFVDLDRFKLVNDTYGHQTGDRLLCAVARRLERCVRQEDTAARIGGDEFALLLDSIADAASVVMVAERILRELREPFEDTVCEDGIGASIGIALSMTGYDTVDQVLHDADTAMYRAKQEGRGCYAVFDTEMYDRMRTQLALESELRAAIDANQLALHYHPVVALDEGTITGMEALVRWSHPDRGVLLPADFIPLAERTGLIVEIGWWVLREACRQLRAWQLEGDAGFRLTMSVNLSGKQFLQPNLVQQLDSIINETGVDPASLRLDLKEAVVMDNPELAAKLLLQIRDRGVQICIDDFGTGYSSLQELQDLPISVLKIAPGFVHQLDAGQGSSPAIVQTIIALGRSMAIEAIAEGVETPEQLSQLRALGMKFAQGFLFSLPLDSERARALLHNPI